MKWNRKELEMNKHRLFLGITIGFLMTIFQAFWAFAGTASPAGHLDSIEGDAIAGWAWNEASPETVQNVTVTITNRSTGATAAVLTAEAGEYREDLQAQGMGTGNCGFHVEADWDSYPEGAYMITLTVEGHSIPQTLYHTTGADDSLVPLGVFKTTAYCPCQSCSEGWGRHTSSGKMASANHTVAVDPKVIPVGSHLLIDGTEYVAEDVGGGVRGNHIDIFYNTHAETRSHGTRSSEVFLIL